MVQYKRVGTHWEVIPESQEKETISDEINAISGVEERFKNDILSKFSKTDGETDYILKIIIPRYYNDGTKVSPDAIASILSNISLVFGGASTWQGKGYWSEENVLYENKNIFIDILLKNSSLERAMYTGKYMSSAIGHILKQEGVLMILTPALGEFYSKQTYEKDMKEAETDVEKLNDIVNEKKSENIIGDEIV